MKKIIKLIVKSNEWYDNLKEPKRTLFFLFVILGTFIVAQYFMYAKSFFWALPIWVTLVMFWRITFVLYNWKNNYLKNKKKGIIVTNKKKIVKT